MTMNIMSNHVQQVNQSMQTLEKMYTIAVETAPKNPLRLGRPESYRSSTIDFVHKYLSTRDNLCREAITSGVNSSAVAEGASLKLEDLRRRVI